MQVFAIVFKDNIAGLSKKIDIISCKNNILKLIILIIKSGAAKDKLCILILNVRCDMKAQQKETSETFKKLKPYLLTLLYLAIFIALYLIYGTGDTQNNFIYNEF